jgi:signal transduction histidine kinase
LDRGARRAHPIEGTARLEQRRLDLQRHLADVAHDLKTPISSLHIALEQAIDANADAEVGTLLSTALHDTVYRRRSPRTCASRARCARGGTRARRGQRPT